jgi:hypothetical protein
MTCGPWLRWPRGSHAFPGSAASAGDGASGWRRLSGKPPASRKETTDFGASLEALLRLLRKRQFPQFWHGGRSARKGEAPGGAPFRRSAREAPSQGEAPFRSIFPPWGFSKREARLSREAPTPCPSLPEKHQRLRVALKVSTGRVVPEDGGRGETWTFTPCHEEVAKSVCTDDYSGP